jgi:2TM domain
MAATAKSMMSLHLAKEATLDSEQRRYERAQARVQELKGFYTHATAYVLVNIGLFVINLLTGGGGGSTGRSLAGA